MRSSSSSIAASAADRSEEHTSELQSRFDLVCRLLLEKKKRYDTVRHRLRFKIVVLVNQLTMNPVFRHFICIRVNRANESGMVNIPISVNSRDRSVLNT